MTIPFLVINLDRSLERREKIAEDAVRYGIHVTRVSGVDGSTFARNSWVDVNDKGFARQHGRKILPGEYGCYRSHLKALELVSASQSPYSIVVEDDVVLESDTLPRVRAIIEAVPRFDLIKLSNHRVRWFVPKQQTAKGDIVGRARHGPLGSAAAYLVSKEGAARLRRRLAIMELPFDIALERYWATGIHFYTVQRNVLNLSLLCRCSTIASSSCYRESKFSPWERLPTLAFRAKDYFRRCMSASL